MPWINKQCCNGCGDCQDVCILDAISIDLGKAEVDMEACHRCGACHDQCQEKAICYGEPRERILMYDNEV
jgi:ferredoxin